MEEKTVTYKTINELEIKGAYYQTNKNNAPLILFIHGGGLIWGTRHDMKKEQIKLYIENGYNVLSIDYRLAPEVKLANILSDIRDSLHWVLQKENNDLNYDPKRVFVIGSSAGGYLALNSGLFEHKPKAIVSFYGYGSILGDWYLKPSEHFNQQTKVPKALVDQLIQNEPIAYGTIENRYAIYLHCRQQGNWHHYVTGLDPKIYREQLLQFCPIEQIENDYPPTLLIHGDQDEDVPYDESLQMYETLKGKNIHTKLVTIPNGKHTFDYDFNSENAQLAFNEVLQFLKQYI